MVMLDLLSFRSRAKSAILIWREARSAARFPVSMSDYLAQLATFRKPPRCKRRSLTNLPLLPNKQQMSVTTIHASKQPRRPHFIREWAEKRGLRQVDLVRQLGADKSIVSRWYKGGSPGEEWQAKLAALFHCEPDAIFRHPDDDWLARFLRGRDEAEIERIKATLEAAFPRRNAG